MCRRVPFMPLNSDDLAQGVPPRSRLAGGSLQRFPAGIPESRGLASRGLGLTGSALQEQAAPRVIIMKALSRYSRNRARTLPAVIFVVFRQPLALLCGPGPG
jgi:hypothetical protein